MSTKRLAEKILELPSTKKAKSDIGTTTTASAGKEDNGQLGLLFTDLLGNSDVWINFILPYVGPGHYLFVALVCRRFKELYGAYYEKIEEDKLPKVWYSLNDFRGQKAIVYNTFYSSAFSSVSCATFWNDSTMEDNERFTDVCRVSAEHGNLPVLKWARQNGFGWDWAVCATAAKFGHLEILKYARQNNCPWNSDTCMNAAWSGNLEILKWARQNNCPWGPFTSGFAARNGHVATLKWAHENGCPWDNFTSAFAAENGQLEALKYVHQEGRLENLSSMCQSAAYFGHQVVLEWLREKGGPWNEKICSEAAAGGQLATLKWARSKGCPWDSRTYTRAISNGHHDIAQWAKENGCPTE